jgi:NAD(P)H-hydrate epimerase
MPDTITSEEMDALDTNCEYFGLPRLALMESAGAAVAGEIEQRFDRGKVVIFAGLGNNGGDAFVAARHLKKFDVEIILLGSPDAIKTEEAKRNWGILKHGKITVQEVRDSKDLRPVKSDIIIDAIFGTGVRGRMREPFLTAINIINGSRAFVLSVDIPSGMDPDTGAGEKVVRADLVLTFHRMKTGLAKYKGDVKVAGIGIPEFIEKLAGPGDVKMVVKRSPDSHKGDNGRVLIVGGGAYFGAPSLAALAALRTGADIVTLAVPKSVSGIISSFSPNFILRPLSGDVLTTEDLPRVRELMKTHDVTVIGMGLGKGEKTVRAIRSIISDAGKLVVDADALIPLKFPRGKTIVTPHAGEFERLSGVEVPEDDGSRISAVKEFSRDRGITTLMKGREDIISDGLRVKVNRTGNAGMTVGGTGDVLAGITAALYAITNDSFKAATAAAFLSGASGDLAFGELGVGLNATDVIEKIPAVIKRYAGSFI